MTVAITPIKTRADYEVALGEIVQLLGSDKPEDDERLQVLLQVVRGWEALHALSDSLDELLYDAADELLHDVDEFGHLGADFSKRATEILKALARTDRAAGDVFAKADAAIGRAGTLPLGDALTYDEADAVFAAYKILRARDFELDILSFEACGPDEASWESRRLGTVVISGATFHAEAFAVKASGDGKQVADGPPELQRWFEHVSEAAAPDGAFETIATPDGRTWALFIYPYC